MAPASPIPGGNLTATLLINGVGKALERKIPPSFPASRVDKAKRELGRNPRSVEEEIGCARKGCQALAQAAVLGGVLRAGDGAGASTC